jgi:hypothetical protein
LVWRVCDEARPQAGETAVSINNKTIINPDSCLPDPSGMIAPDTDFADSTFLIFGDQI